MTAHTSSPIGQAQLIALFVECILYGIFLVSLGHCLRTLLFTREDGHQGLKIRANVNRRLLVIALLLCLFPTLNVALGVRRCLNTFIYYDGPAEEELGNTSSWVNILKVCQYANVLSSSHPLVLTTKCRRLISVARPS